MQKPVFYQIQLEHTQSNPGPNMKLWQESYQ